MAFDGFVTKAIVKELQKTIIDAKVNKVLEPTKNEVVLSLYNAGKNYSLLISASPEYCRINLTDFSRPNPQNAYNFCMLLRKYLVGGKVVSIDTYDLERTVEIQFACYDELNDLVIRKLYVEIMSRQSNIVLTNGQDVIIDTLHKLNSSRTILPANPYTPVSSNKKSFLQLEYFQDFNDIIQNKKNLGEISLSKILVAKFIGFSKIFANELMVELNISDESFDEDDLKKLYNYLKRLLSAIDSGDVFCKKLSEKDFVLALNQRNSRGEKKESNPINYFIDGFYYYKEEQTTFINSRNSLLKIVSSSLKKVYKKVENINSKLKECEKKDTYKLYGELLTANLYKINASENLDSIVLENYYDNNAPITIPLDKTLSIQKNIEKYFKKYNKLKNALAIVTNQKKDAEKELNYIESIVFSLSNAKTMHDINGIYEEIVVNLQPRRMKNVNSKSSSNSKKSTNDNNNHVELTHLVLDNFTIYVGKNNTQNDYISTKVAKPNDVWFHTQQIHGSHVLLKNPNNLELEDIPEEIIFKCASLAKENSKGASSTNVSVDYCYAKYIKKPSGSKPGMVTYNNYKTMIIK